MNDILTFEQYVPYVNVLNDYLEKLPVYFYDGDARNLVVICLHPDNEISFVTDSAYKEENIKLMDKVKLDNFLYTYLVETVVPEEGLFFLVDSSTSDLIYDYGDKSLIEWKKIGTLPPLGQDYQLIFYENEEKEQVPVRMAGAKGRDTSLYMRHHTPNLFSGVNPYPSCGRDLITELYSRYYSIEEVPEQYKTWAIMPNKVDSLYTKDQTKTLEKVVTKVRGSSPTKITLTYEDTLFPDKCVPLSWIQKQQRIPYLYKYTFVLSDVCLGTSDKAIINITSLNGRLTFNVRSVEDFDVDAVCTTLGIYKSSITIVEEY